MTTVDGSTSFSGQLQCPNSQRFMEVLIQPGATGDITTFIVSQDTNFDGNLDYTFQVPFPVSGICANGVITCSPGTWTNCRTYQWASDTSGRVSLQVSSPHGPRRLLLRQQLVRNESRLRQHPHHHERHRGRGGGGHTEE